MRAARFLPTRHVLEVDPSAHHVLEFAAGVFDRFLNDLETAPGLAVKVARRRHATTRRDRRGTGHRDMRSDAHRARKADLRLIDRTGRNELPLHHCTRLLRSSTSDAMIAASPPSLCSPAMTPAWSMAGRFWLTFHLPSMRAIGISMPTMPLTCAVTKASGASLTCHGTARRPSLCRVRSSIWLRNQPASSITCGRPQACTVM